MKRGGVRQGAGRKAKGVRKSVTINLPEGDWEHVQFLIREKDIALSDYFRGLVDRTLTDDLQQLNFDQSDEECF